MNYKVITVGNRHHDKNMKGEYIGRPHILGNPFSHLENTKATYKVESREEAIAKYREYLPSLIESSEEVRREMNRLYSIAKKGHLHLICWCHPLPCHCDVVKELIESKL